MAIDSEESKTEFMSSLPQLPHKSTQWKSLTKDTTVSKLIQGYKNKHPDRAVLYHEIEMGYRVLRYENNVAHTVEHLIRHRLAAFFLVATKLPKQLFHHFPFLIEDHVARESLLTGPVTVPGDILEEAIQNQQHLDTPAYIEVTREWLNDLLTFGQEVRYGYKLLEIT